MVVDLHVHHQGRLHLRHARSRTALKCVVFFVVVSIAVWAAFVVSIAFWVSFVVVKATFGSSFVVFSPSGQPSLAMG